MVLTIPSNASFNVLFLILWPDSHILFQVLKFPDGCHCKVHAINLKMATRWAVIADALFDQHVALLAVLFDHVAESSIKPNCAFIEEVVQLL